MHKFHNHNQVVAFVCAQIVAGAQEALTSVWIHHLDLDLEAVVRGLPSNVADTDVVCPHRCLSSLGDKDHSSVEHV